MDLIVRKLCSILALLWRLSRQPFFKETLLHVEAQAELSFESSFAFDIVLIWTNPPRVTFLSWKISISSGVTPSLLHTEGLVS